MLTGAIIGCVVAIGLVVLSRHLQDAPLHGEVVMSAVMVRRQ